MPLIRLILIITSLATFALTSCNKSSSKTTPNSTVTQGSPTQKNQTELERALEQKLTSICSRAQGSIGVAAVHVETGRAVSVNGNAVLPLYSVFKLPLAIAVLKNVEANRLKVDQMVHVTPDEIVPGTPENTALWSKPVDQSVAQLIEYSISRSDNTSTDKLLQLVGGPAQVTEQMRSLGFNNLDIHSTVMDYVKTRQSVNTGSADDLASLLTQLQQGKILQPPQSQLLIGYMRGAITGMRRLRGDLPPGTIVADKTGSGERNTQTNVPKATNDVGLITLPNGKGTLAMAVLVTDSRLVDTAQEKIIAELARAAFDAYANP
ncbi:MAG TPA: class A beta-lactamase [Pyrinomonadaceae bacterium]|nr:class A beta-lactamase [Pyrinomonadaceae bacterium]